eukprot:CAMPEP_0201914308 /NCGR_PEP_ID=MMETSP0903-20130614/4524_1 /ASSEMBLY_ACC=CAM_ASM_000552 /TAXON_ID=420261 /ORGANISM="Thalassiosira antarctica, Strain CCMP982" /LENGTH=76 /DNA_ID=CAMNT_0048449669 /DNA_START=458 /DNA_END=688 /DNA_ORIENTATION=+
MERRKKWASYYASNSAALAHYHLALSKAGGGKQANNAAPSAVTNGFDANRMVLSERAQRFKGNGGIHNVSNDKSTV